MHFLLLRRPFSPDLNRHGHRHIRTLYDAVSVLNRPQDRGLDHAVARERHLKPLHSLKDLILSEPSKSIPLSLIAQLRETLEIPFRPIEFIRKYPSVFQEFHPGGPSLNLQPHIKLTSEVVDLNTEESLVYGSVDYRQEIANRVLKLLMISRVNKVPILLLEQLKWELGLPNDYEKAIIPEFPDYFRVVGGGNRKELELVCWGDEFAVSEMERKRTKDGEIRFPLQYSNEFEMDKKYKKWVDDWQKLPYVSPYENARHLGAKTDESDKWAVAVLHELLSLCVGKKAERENLLRLGEYFGLRSRFKVAFLQHPGIFYVSSKINTHTVVLREAYKRGMLIERHALNDVRFKYVQLMNVEKNAEKEKEKEKSKSTKKKKSVDVNNDKGENPENDVSREEVDADLSDDDESEDYTEDEEEEDDEEDEDEDNNAVKRGKIERNVANFEQRNPGRGVAKKFSGRSFRKNDYADEDENAIKRGKFRKNATNFEQTSSKRGVPRSSTGRGTQNNEYDNSKKFSGRSFRRNGYAEEDKDENAIKRRTFGKNVTNFEQRNSTRGGPRSFNGRSTQKNEYDSSNRYSRRRNIRDYTKPSRAREKSDASEDKEFSRTKKTPT